MKRHVITRRKLVKGLATGALGASLVRSAGPALGALGANERMVIGCIGTGGQGTFHLGQWAKMKDVRIAAICDVDTSHRDRAVQLAGSSPKGLKDFREVLQMKEVDAVCIATPDHWHAILAIQACRAGKHVYVEKPIGHNIKEGRVIAEAATKAGVVVLHGTQQRSDPHWINAVKRIKAGELGKVGMVHVWNAWNTKEMFGKLATASDGEPPPGVDYDRWLGPAPARPFNPVRFHGSFYFFWDYSGGMMTAWAVHLFDIVLWAMGPQINSVTAVGGKFVFDDPRDTPDTADAVFECPGYTMVYTMRHGNGWRPHGDLDHGIEFFGTEATLHVNRAGFQVYRDEDRASRKPFYSEPAVGGWDQSFIEHKRHFLDCIRTGAALRCDAQTGHVGSIPGHLANVSYRVGHKVRWDAKTESVIEDADAARLLGREYRAPWHL